MTPLSSIKAFRTACLAFISLFAASCSSSTNGKCPGCKDGQTLNATISFRIVDKTTNEDLFFGKQPKYNISDLKIHHIIYRKSDSLLAPVKVDVAGHSFNINVLYQGDADTILMQIGRLKQDTLYVGTGITTQCCPHVFVASATYNGSVLYNTFNNLKADTVKAKVIEIPR